MRISDWSSDVCSSDLVRLRQIAILQVAWTKKARYMWASHLRTSLRLGLVPDDFAAIRRGPEAPHWSPAERTILATINELRDHAALCDASWAALRGVLDARQIGSASRGDRVCQVV